MPRAKKTANAAAVADLFGGKKAPKAKKTASKKVKKQVQFPKELRDDADVMCAYRLVKDDLKKKGDVAEKRCERFMRRWWCEEYEATGKKPEMAHFSGANSGIDFVQTRRMTLTADKQEALEMMGVDISDHIETTGVEINMEAVKKMGLMEKLQNAIASIVDNPEQLAEILQPKISVGEKILEELPSIADESELDGSQADKMEQILEVLKPTAQKKKPEVPGKTAVECFELVTKASISNK